MFTYYNLIGWDMESWLWKWDGHKTGPGILFFFFFSPWEKSTLLFCFHLGRPGQEGGRVFWILFVFSVCGEVLNKKSLEYISKDRTHTHTHTHTYNTRKKKEKKNHLPPPPHSFLIVPSFGSSCFLSFFLVFFWWVAYVPPKLSIRIWVW